MTEELLKKIDLQLFAATDDADKTEDPTPHRLREARKRGQVFKSAELNAAVNLLGVILLLFILSGSVFDAFKNLFQVYIGEGLNRSLDGQSSIALARMSLGSYFGLAAPILAAAVITGLSANFLQVGFVFTGVNMAPQLHRLNPLEGVKRVLSRRALFELVKAVLKIVVVGATSYVFIRERLLDMLLLLNQEAEVSALFFWKTVMSLGLQVSSVFLALALFDYLFQRHEYQKSLRMSRRDIRDELKHLEGDPLVRSRIRERQRYLARQRMLQEVPRSDVVITNPTELAVALRYRPEESEAPVILAKGAGVLAERIKEIAREHDIPVVENPFVARMIFKEGEVGREIPVKAYQVVAEILAMVYRLKGNKL